MLLLSQVNEAIGTKMSLDNIGIINVEYRALKLLYGPRRRHPSLR